jgi:hypothetical protein
MGQLSVRLAAVAAFGLMAMLSGCKASVCGGLQGKSCEANEFCDFPQAAQCGAADQTGTCEAKPQVCNDLYAPVCGCDGKTYANECSANRVGISVASSGACDSGGGTGEEDASAPAHKTCGGIAALQCGKGEFCDYEVAAGGQGCDGTIADAAGVCETKPEVCTAIYAPVCGCDGKTYSSACNAHAAGASVASNGACKP